MDVYAQQKVLPTVIVLVLLLIGVCYFLVMRDNPISERLAQWAHLRTETCSLIVADGIFTVFLTCLIPLISLLTSKPMLCIACPVVFFGGFAIIRLVERRSKIK